MGVLLTLDYFIMLYSLLLTLGIILLIWAMYHIRRQAPEQQRRLGLRYSLYGLVLVIIGLVITGKLHWLAAAVAALLPLAQKASVMAIRVLPLLYNWRRQRQRAEQRRPAKQASGPMSVEQALKIFGLETLPSATEVTQRHRALMQKNHPDRGGSDYLAAQINEAKAVLLAHIRQNS